MWDGRFLPFSIAIAIFRQLACLMEETGILGSNCRPADKFNHIHLYWVSKLCTNKSLFLILIAACLAENLQIPIIQSLNRPRIDTTIQCIWIKHVNHYTTDVIIESDLYLEVTSGAKKKWSFKTDEYLNEVQFRWIFLWQDKTKVAF